MLKGKKEEINMALLEESFGEFFPTGKSKLLKIHHRIFLWMEIFYLTILSEFIYLAQDMCFLRFEPLAQLVEHHPFKVRVRGSNPRRLTTFIPHEISH